MSSKASCLLINRPSNSAREIARSLGLMRVRPERFRLLRYRIGINWGVGGNIERRANQSIYNPPEAVRTAANKLLTFQRLREQGSVPIPDFTTSLSEAKNFKAKRVVGRSRLTGSSGEGIEILSAGNKEDWPALPLYTPYYPKKYEYRIHVVRGDVIFVQQKRKKNGVEGSPIRSHANGYVFAENEVTFPSEEIKQRTLEAAVNAVSQLNLDFGAVDAILATNMDHSPVILEVNTAPGLESTRLKEAYRDHFARL